MSKVYFTSLSNAFAEALAAVYRDQGFEVVTEPSGEIEYFIDTTDARIPGDDKAVGEGLDAEAMAAAYRANVCEPLRHLEAVLSLMTGKRRICFCNSRDASINYSEATFGYGHNMAKAALNQILVLTKNGLIEKGYTFRLFDPMAGPLPAQKAAGSAFVYFTRDRFEDGPDNRFRQDERNLIVRDALGREIPW